MQKDHSHCRNVFFESPLLMRSEKSLDVTVSWATSSDIKAFTTAICVINDIASNVFALISETNKCRVAGKVYLTGDAMKQAVGELYTFADNVLFVICTSPIPAECCYKWTKIVLSQCTRCIVFDAIARKTVQTHNNSLLRSITTSTTPPTTFPHLEVGNVVGSLTASIITHCEFCDIPCVAYVALREAQYTAEAARAFEELLPQLREVLDDPTVRFPGVEFYRDKRRSDIFLLNTENMYT